VARVTAPRSETLNRGRAQAGGNRVGSRVSTPPSGGEGYGSLVAPFSGEHGWYWVNVSDQPVTITLFLKGYYSEIKNYGLL
jgi:hypothetical protein